MENYKDKKIVTNMFVSKIITEICRSHIAELPWADQRESRTNSTTIGMIATEIHHLTRFTLLLSIQIQR